MNIFEKFKYKKILDGCDYVLAGEVLKEKFLKHAERNETISSKLIETYLSNPCIDHALELISHDPMMVFYFNECKENGLYQRQRRTKSETAASAETNMQPAISAAAPVSNASIHDITTMNPQATKFPNVISTLIYDYNEISNQIKEFQRNIDAGKEVSKYQSSLKKYEEALTEFETAIKVLQKYSKG